ncbi:MAG: hypothetical protein LC109_14290 [Bacteroidia bacterium]|nr:hypothetical protein [Bacteroidia bacterium]MCO5252802.1 hypothetical protein [Bacteroidota bacterium]MCZ2131419.1 hypothetical protein [Bacteroidia bacterium]
MKKNPLNLTLVAFALFYSNVSLGQEKRNFVSPNDPALQAEYSYDNPARHCYHLGVNIGVAGLQPQPSLFWQVTGSYSPKHFIFMGKYQNDMLIDLLTGKKENKYIKVGGQKEFAKKMNPLNEIEFSVGYNFKDEIVKEDVSPTIGIDVTGTSISGNVQTTYYYAYYTNYEVSTRYTSGLNLGMIMGSATMSYDTSKAKLGSNRISFEDPSTAPPFGYIIPYKTTTFTLGYISTVTSGYKAKFQYKSLRRTKFRSDATYIMGCDLLYAPLITRSDEAFYTDTSNSTIVLSSKIKDAKLSRFGFRMYTIRARKNIPGLYYTAELGFRPGIYYDKRWETDPDASAWDKTFNKIGKFILTPPWYMKFGIGFSI